MQRSISRSILCIYGRAIVDKLLQMLHVTVAADLTEKHNRYLMYSTYKKISTQLMKAKDLLQAVNFTLFLL